MGEYNKALDAMSNEAVEYVRGIPVVKTFGQSVFSFKRFKASIDQYQKWVIAYTIDLRLPMTLYTTLVNACFSVLIGLTLFVVKGGGVDGHFLLNLLYYIIITPAIAVTLNRIMFASENEMIVGMATPFCTRQAAHRSNGNGTPISRSRSNDSKSTHSRTDSGEEVPPTTWVMAGAGQHPG